MGRFLPITLIILSGISSIYAENEGHALLLSVDGNVFFSPVTNDFPRTKLSKYFVNRTWDIDFGYSLGYRKNAGIMHYGVLAGISLYSNDAWVQTHITAYSTSSINHRLSNARLSLLPNVGITLFNLFSLDISAGMLFYYWRYSEYLAKGGWETGDWEPIDADSWSTSVLAQAKIGVALNGIWDFATKMGINPFLEYGCLYNIPDQRLETKASIGADFLFPL